MELSYDSKYNVAYIRFRDKIEEVETIKISDELCIDISSDGKIYGIELLNANEQLGITRGTPFAFINEAVKQRKEMPLT